MIYIALVIAALVVAIVGIVESRGHDFGSWAAGLLAVALLYAKL